MIYISTSSLKGGRDIKVVLDAYKKAGIKNVELGSAHQYIPDLSVLDNYNFNYLVHNYFPPPKEDIILNLASQDPNILAQAKQLVQDAIDLCVKLGCKFYSVHPGYRQDPDINFRFDLKAPITPYEKAFNTFIASVKELNEYAKNKGIKLAIENNIMYTEEFGDCRELCLLNTAEEFLDMFKVIPSENLCMLLDLGHLNVNAYHMKFNKDEFIEKIRHKVIALHTSENSGKSDEHLELKENSYCLKKVREFSDMPITFEGRKLTISQILESKELLEAAIR